MSALRFGSYRDVRFLDVWALGKDEGVAAEGRRTIEEFPCDREATLPQKKSWARVQGAMREMQAARRGEGLW